MTYAANHVVLNSKSLRVTLWHREEFFSKEIHKAPSLRAYQELALVPVVTVEVIAPILFFHFVCGDTDRQSLSSRWEGGKLVSLLHHLPLTSQRSLNR